MKKTNKFLKLILTIIIVICVVICGYGNVKATENAKINISPTEVTSTTQGTDTTEPKENENTNSNNQKTNNNNEANKSNSQEVSEQETEQESQTEERNSSTATTTETTKTTQNNTTKKSSNANLRMLGITPNDFKGFKSGTTTYSVTVPNNIEQIKVYATAQDSKATISGTGNQKLNIGENIFKVIVKAENGTEKEYTINVEREEGNANATADATEQSNSSDETNSKKDLVKLDIAGYSISPKFSPDIYEYKLEIKEDVNELNVTTKTANDNIKVDIAGNKDIKEGENTITILVYNNETKENTTYQIIVTKLTDKSKNEKNTDVNPAYEKAKKIRIIIIGLISLIVMGIITFLIVKHRQININVDNNKYKYDMEDQEKINLDNEEELFNRVNKEKLTKIPREPEIKNEKKQESRTDNKDKEELFRTTLSKKEKKY